MPVHLLAEGWKSYLQQVTDRLGMQTVGYMCDHGLDATHSHVKQAQWRQSLPWLKTEDVELYSDQVFSSINNALTLSVAFNEALTAGAEEY